MAAMGDSFEGRWEQVKDRVKLTMAKVGEALFNSVKDSLTKLANWLQKNEANIQKWATKVGEYINKAFLAIRDGVMWLVEHETVLKGILLALVSMFTVLAARAAMAWLAIAGPVIGVAAVIALFLKLRDVLGDVGAAIVAAFAVGALIAFKRVLDGVLVSMGLMKAAKGVGAGSMFMSGIGGGKGAAAARGATGALAGLGPWGAALAALSVVDSIVDPENDKKVAAAQAVTSTMMDGFARLAGGLGVSEDITKAL